MHTFQSPGDKQACVAVLQSLEAAMLQANSFPNPRDLDVLQVTSPEYKKSTNQLKKRLVAIVRSVASRYAVSSRSTDSDSSSSNSTSSVTPRDHLHDETLETTEEALECFNAALDAARGIHNAIVQPNGALGPNPASLKIGLGYLGKRNGGCLDIEKPQIHFPDYPIDNSQNPFVPPYSHGSIHDPATADANTEHVDRHLQDLFRNNSKHDGERRHPYEEEISVAAAEMAKKTFPEENTIVYGSVEATPCTMVTTEEELFNIAERLKRVSELAMDLENHSIRSFQGFTCLLQISTRREDFVIDTLKLRGSINRALAPIFADETITKVLHGADQDVQWLERDFGIYVVNMFDTGQAARLLKLPSASLSFLLAKYCDVTGNNKKKFQLADWRQRPLPKDMFEYARSDTHYLLYVYDRVRTELSKDNLLADAWERSAKICRKRHSKTRYDPFMAKRLAARHGLGFDGRQLRLLEALCRWRDVTAREEDESSLYVAPLHTLFGIVRSRDAARTVPGLMSHGFPMRRVPPLVYRDAEAITRLVCDALDAKLENSDENKQAVIGNSDASEKKTQKERARTKNLEEDSAPQQEKARISTADQGSQDAHVSSTVAEQKSSIDLPEAKVRKLSKCAFFDSESGSESDSGKKIHCTESFGKENIDDGNEVSCDTKSEKLSQEKIAKEESNLSKDGQVKGRKADAAETRGNTRATSVFDLSDSDEDNEDREEADSGKMKAAQVAQELDAELAEKAKKLKSVEFETELVARKREREELARKEKILDEERMKEETKTEVQEKFVSLLESEGRKGDSAPRRKRKRAREAVSETKRLDAFDYTGAMKEMKQKKDGRQKDKSFDPMEGLKGERNMVGRSKAKRRRRGRGKSMSFSS